MKDGLSPGKGRDGQEKQARLKARQIIAQPEERKTQDLLSALSEMVYLI